MYRLMIFSIAVFTFISLIPVYAHAYIDPGSGSFFMQMLAAGFIGAVFHFRRFFAKIFFWKNKEDSNSLSEIDNP